MSKNIAIVILNYIQYINIKPAIDEFIKLGYSVDIYCQQSQTDDGFKELFDDNVSILVKNGYKVYRNSSKDKKYKVLLEPYPSMKIDSKYRIKYRYGTISAKPDIVYGHPENFIIYDAILCSGNYDANYLSVYSKTYITGNMKYMDFIRKKPDYGKKILLYLPTYGKCSSIDLIADYLPILKEKYYVITKIHHGTCFLKEEKYRIEKIKNNVNEFYDLHKDLSELLSIADVVLTDNSGSIFESIYSGVPVAIFSDDINQNKWGTFNTTQYELFKEGIIPYTTELEKIDEILVQAQTTRIKQLQQKWSEENLYHPKNQLKDFIHVVEKYLNDDIDKRYFDFHTEFKNNYLKLYNDDIESKRIINNLESEISNLKLLLNKKENQLKDINKKLKDNQKQIDFLTATVNYYKNGKLYKIANKIYKIKNGE